MFVLAAMYRSGSGKFRRNADKRSWFPRLVPFVDGWDHRSRLQLPGCRRWTRSVAQLFEVKLIHAAAVGLRNRDKEVVDRDLFALFGQMTEQMRDVPGDGADIRAFE